MHHHSVSQLAYVELLTPQIEQSTEFITRLAGLTESVRTEESMNLPPWGESFHHSLKLARARQADLGVVGWRTGSSESLERLAEELEQVGAAQGWTHGDRLRPSLSVQYSRGHVGKLLWDFDRYAAPGERRSRFRNRPERRHGDGGGTRFLGHATLVPQTVLRD
jgi:catechol 2,3-dioxygenase